MPNQHIEVHEAHQTEGQRVLSRARGTLVREKDIVSVIDDFSRIKDQPSNATNQAIDYMIKVAMLVERMSLERASLATATTTRIPEAPTGTYPFGATTTSNISETNSILDSCNHHSEDFTHYSQRGVILSSGTKQSGLLRLDTGFVCVITSSSSFGDQPSSSVKDDDTTTLVWTTTTTTTIKITTILRKPSATYGTIGSPNNQQDVDWGIRTGARSYIKLMNLSPLGYPLDSGLQFDPEVPEDTLAFRTFDPLNWQLVD
ncbi:hypothetical protein DL770_004777 [Monosporascus sp. CRB-9-2]|nr:hypothetical protein DL770_004777 [Monosporascus sp. CRB-9-2]